MAASWEWRAVRAVHGFLICWRCAFALAAAKAGVFSFWGPMLTALGFVQMMQHCAHYYEAES